MNLYTASASERNIQNACMDYLRLRGWFVIETSQRWAADPRMAGLPDILAWRDGGVSMLLELKTARGKLRAAQVKFAANIWPCLSSTLHYAVIRDVDELITLEDNITRRDLSGPAQLAGQRHNETQR